MATQVLVAYATKYGSTQEIAERIGQVLRDAGLSVEVLPAKGVRDLSPYGAVVLGGGVYIGGWHKEAANFLKANEQALAERPVWIFSSGPTGTGPLQAFMGDTTLPKSLLPVADRIHPRDIAIFRGVLDLSKLNFIERWMIGNVKAPVGDFREWPVIEAWAKSIADALK